MSYEINSKEKNNALNKNIRMFLLAENQRDVKKSGRLKLY
jgi:hypothetical protein